MTDAEPQQAQPGRRRLARGGLRRWRRTRPFWGGLLTGLAGLEIFGTTQMSLAGLSFQTGPTGFLSWLIPAILVTCGLLMWFKPQHRVLYAVVAAVTALFSLIGVNLGGFFFGLILGIVGSALGYAWTPEPAAVVGRGEPEDDATTRVSTGEGRGGSPDAARDESPDEATTRRDPAAGPGPDRPAPGAGPAPSGSSRPSSTS